MTTKMAETNAYNFRVAKSNAEAESNEYKQTAEQRQKALEADVARFLADGGIITKVETNDSY